MKKTGGSSLGKAKKPMAKTESAGNANNMTKMDVSRYFMILSSK